MNKNEMELNKFAIEREREKSKHERYLKFENYLRYLLCELKDEATREDDFALDEIKQCVIVYVMKDYFEETNNIFLQNMKNDFYHGIKELESRHSDIKSRTLYIKLFMEDFYFNVDKHNSK